jgi:hypothetical protein
VTCRAFKLWVEMVDFQRLVADGQPMLHRIGAPSAEVTNQFRQSVAVVRIL